MVPEHRVNYEHQMQQQDTKILTTRSCYKNQFIAVTSGMEQNKQEGWPGLQHVMGTPQSLPQSVVCLLGMAEILRNNLPIASLLHACSPSPISLFTSQTPNALKNTSGCPEPAIQLYPHVLLANAYSGPFQRPYCFNSPYSSHRFFTSLHMSGQHPPTPVILRGYSMVSSHATPFSIHHQPSVIVRVLKIYIHLLPSLVPSQHPATQSSYQPPNTTMLCPQLLLFSEHSCLVFANENNRPMSPSIFPHLPF